MYSDMTGDGTVETTSNSPHEIRELLSTIRGEEEKSSIEMGALLWEVKQRKLFKTWGFPNMAAYLEQELHIAERTGQVKIKVYQRFCRELEIAREQITKVGWTKAAALLPIVTPMNVVEWLGKAEELSVRQLVAAVNASMSEDEKDLADMRETIKIRVTPGVKAKFEEAMEWAKTELSTGDNCEAVEFITEEYQGGNLDDGRCRRDAFARVPEVEISEDDGGEENRGSIYVLENEHP